MPSRPLSLLLSLALLATGAPAAVPAAAQTVAPSVIRRPNENRPAGLALLLERDIAGGKQALGVYGAVAEPAQPGVWRIKVWEELPNDVKVRSETIRCSPSGPMRVTNDGRNLILRQLNPGGAVSPANRIDHLVWWATCFPEQAGKDPATLGALARKLGFSGLIVEREEVVPAGGR